MEAFVSPRPHGSVGYHVTPSHPRLISTTPRAIVVICAVRFRNTGSIDNLSWPGQPKGSASIHLSSICRRDRAMPTPFWGNVRPQRHAGGVFVGPRGAPCQDKRRHKRWRRQARQENRQAGDDAVTIRRLLFLGAPLRVSPIDCLLYCANRSTLL